MRLFDMIRKKQKYCLLHGCDAELKTCACCGWNKRETARRKRLPLVRCADGLRRKFVGGLGV